MIFDLLRFLLLQQLLFGTYFELCDAARVKLEHSKVSYSLIIDCPWKVYLSGGDYAFVDVDGKVTLYSKSAVSGRGSLTTEIKLKYANGKETITLSEQEAMDICKDEISNADTSVTIHKSDSGVDLYYDAYEKKK
eukprot:Lankesteria_metandrocarpae@DN10811_c0_g1_i1.p1